MVGMDNLSIRWLASREGDFGDGDKTLLLFVRHVEHGVASLCIKKCQEAKQDVVIDDYINKEFTWPLSNYQSNIINLDEATLTRDQILSYSYRNVNSALNWVKSNDFPVDIYMLAELVRALYE